MIFLKFLPLGFVLGVGAFFILGPGNGWLRETFDNLQANVAGAKNGTSIQVLGSDESNQAKRAAISLPNAVEQILAPVTETSSNIQKSIEQIKKLPENELNAVKYQICNPQ